MANFAKDQMLSWGDVGGGNLTAAEFANQYGSIGKITPSGTYEQYQTYDAENPLVNGREFYYGTSPVYRESADGSKTLADLMPVYGDKQTWVTGTGGMDGTASGYQTDTSDDNLVGYRMLGGTVHGSGDRWWANYDKDGKFTGFSSEAKDSGGFLVNNQGLIQFLMVAAGGALAAGTSGAAAAGGGATGGLGGSGISLAAPGELGIMGSGAATAGNPALMAGFSAADAADAYAGYTGPSLSGAPEGVSTLTSTAPTTIDTVANASNPIGYTPQYTSAMPPATEGVTIPEWDIAPELEWAPDVSAPSTIDFGTMPTNALDPLVEASTSMSAATTPSAALLAGGMTAESLLQGVQLGTISPLQALQALASGSSAALPSLLNSAISGASGLVSGALSNKYTLGAGLSLLSSWLKNRQMVQMTEEQRRIYNRNVGTLV